MQMKSRVQMTAWVQMTDSKTNKNVTLRLTEEQRNRIGAIAQGKGHKFQWLLENYLEWYSKTGITPWNQPAAPVTKTSADSIDLGPPWKSPAEAESEDQRAVDKKRPVRYKPQNLPWHDRLETVLNDPEEAGGIQKNLEWAEKAVLGKTPPRKQPTGKSGGETAA